jgi:SAM-dependent methyltransferase
MHLIKKLRAGYDALFPPYQKDILNSLEGCSSILDVGCGSLSPVSRIRGKARLIGVDAYDGSIQKARERKTHDEFHVCDVLRLGGIFPDQSFDGVVALDLIEHLEKKDGLALLDSIERIARKRVVIFTPNGFLPQGEYDNNPWQVHKSGWEVSEMQARGYRTIGLNGWRPLRGERGYVKWWPHLPWIVFSDLTQYFVRNRPEKAYQILCVKYL